MEWTWFFGSIEHTQSSKFGNIQKSNSGTKRSVNQRRNDGPDKFRIQERRAIEQRRGEMICDTVGME